MNPLLHGGDLEAFGRQNPEALRPLIDLSTGINPRAYEVSIDKDWLARLPGRADEEACRAAFATCTGVEQELVHVLPGTQAIISGLPHQFREKRVAVLSPTYGEHEASWRAAGHTVSTYPPSEILTADADVIVVTNPNNPDGHIFEEAALHACRARQQARDGWLIVDEAFIDCMPELSVAKEVKRDGLLVLRSFGKFFGLAGLRLGFLLAPENIAAPLAQRLGPWSASTPALRVAAKAYGDVNWIEETRLQLNQQMDRLLERVVPRCGREVGRTPLFALLKVENSEGLARHLADHGIFIRTFPNMPNYLRFGLPGEPWAWDRLETALTEWECKHEC